MPASVIQANYELLEQIARQFTERATNTEEVLRYIIRQMEDLQRDGWWGTGADAFYAEMEDDVLPGVKRLKGALNQAGETTQRIIQIMMDAEDQAGGGFNGGEPGSGGGGGGGGGGAIPPAPPGIPSDRWNQLMNSSFYFKLGGDVFGSFNWVKALAALGVVVPEPATTGAGLATLAAMTGISAALKYGEKFGEEPNLIRGGSIALLDAVMGTAIDSTGVGTAVQLASSIHQMYGGLEVVQSRLIAETANISPSMHDSLFTTTENYYNTMSKTDPTNVRYEVARLAYDVYSAPRQAVVNQLHEWGVPGADFLGSATGTPVNSDFNLGTSVGRVWTSTTDIFVGAAHYPEAWVEMKMAQGASVVNSAVNNSFLPDDFKSSITQTTDGVMGYLANTSATDAVMSVMPWNW